MTLHTTLRHQRLDGVSPLLIKTAVERSGNDELAGAYCDLRHVWIVDGGPIVETKSGLAELTTKTDAELERDDSSEPSLLELQTKTKAEIEKDDQDFEIQLNHLPSGTTASLHLDE